MAGITVNDQPNTSRRYFSPKMEKILKDEDSAAGRAVSLILIAIIGFGLVSMIVSLSLAL